MATATKVLTELRREGLVRAVPGVGTVVDTGGRPARTGATAPAPPARRSTPDRALTPYDEAFRDPYVLDFLGLEDAFSEKDLEAALVRNIEKFLLELGSDFCFVGRQRRVTFDNEHYWIDLLLYNRRLRCLVALDLILGRFRHEYAGAMNFYLNYLKAEEMEAGEGAPIGILLCSEKNETHVEYALGGMSNRIFVSRYLPHVPMKEELETFVRRTRRRLEA